MGGSSQTDGSMRVYYVTESVTYFVYNSINMNFKSAIEQHYACRTNTIPTVGRSVMSHTKR
jgi:hypothetical protein